MTATAKRHYWGIVKGDEVLQTGTHNDMWAALVKTYGNMTLKALDAQGIKLTRIS